MPSDDSRDRSRQLAMLLAMAQFAAPAVGHSGAWMGTGPALTLARREDAEEPHTHAEISILKHCEVQAPAASQVFISPAFRVTRLVARSQVDPRMIFSARSKRSGPLA